MAAPEDGVGWTLHAEKDDKQVSRRNHWRYATEMSRGELAPLGTRFSLDTEIFRPSRRERMSVYHDFMRPNRQGGFVARYWMMEGSSGASGCPASTARSRRMTAGARTRSSRTCGPRCAPAAVSFADRATGSSLPR